MREWRNGGTDTGYAKAMEAYRRSRSLINARGLLRLW